MNNKYDTFDDKNIKYSYPIDWKKRNKKYLEKIEDRKLEEIEEFPLEQEECFCEQDVVQPNPDMERGNFLIINCGDSTDTSV